MKSLHFPQISVPHFQKFANPQNFEVLKLAKFFYFYSNPKTYISFSSSKALSNSRPHGPSSFKARWIDITVSESYGPSKKSGTVHQIQSAYGLEKRPNFEFVNHGPSKNEHSPSKKWSSLCLYNQSPWHYRLQAWFMNINASQGLSKMLNSC